MSKMRLGAMACFGLSALASFALPHPVSRVMAATPIFLLVAGVLLLVYESKNGKRFVWQALFFLLLAYALVPLGSVVVGLMHQNYALALNSLLGLAVLMGSALFARGRILATRKE